MPRLLFLVALLAACDPTTPVDTDTGDADTTPVAEDLDSDGFTVEDGDCDDRDGLVFPGASELCDGIDNDCDDAIDEEAVDEMAWFADADDDGAGAPEQRTLACDAPEGFVDNDSDCDDNAADRFPGAEERCDGRDNDCDGEVDNNATDARLWFADGDDDGFGTDTSTVLACSAPEGFVARDGDCDDTNTAFNPGVVESDCADPNDYNCDGQVGFADADNDGFAACEECNDDDANSFPGADERCDGRDNDCNGFIDDEPIDPETFFVDADADGWGSDDTVLACAPSMFLATRSGDCEDSNDNIFPGAPELCNSLDDNCNGQADESGTDGDEFYEDLDGDGFGTDANTQRACTVSEGYADNSDDCDDDNPAINPDAPSDPGNGIDDDCDGQLDEDHVFTTRYADVQAIWTRSCSGGSCHDATSPRAGLNLLPGSRSNLVNRPAQQLNRMSLVAPFDAANSYLMHKLDNTQGSVGGSGSAMPRGAPLLSGTERDLVRAWILDGAPE